MVSTTISWLVCTLVAVAIATNSSDEHFIDFISELSTAEPAPQFTASTGVGLAAREGAVAAGDARLVAHTSPEPPPHTSSTAPAGSWTSPYPATQPHSNHSGLQTPATAAPTMATSTITEPDDDHISVLRRLSPEDKNRRLIAAAKEGAVGELEALLAAGADVGAGDEWGRTALHWAAVMGREEAARRLLAAGAAVDHRDSIGQRTPLHWAAYWGRAAVVRLLLAAGAEHSARDDRGWTALHWAAHRGQAEAAVALLEAGADRGARDEFGGTPLDVARWYNRQQLVELLQGDTRLTASTSPE